jgi:DNA-binding response OmpR family regulator
MRPTVLCIDDDERSLFIRSKILERLDYRVLTAKSAADGLKLFSREGADVVILDYYMPDMSGAQVAWELKRRGSKVPVLMLSSAVFCPDDASDVVDAFCAKIDGPANLVEVLQRLVTIAEGHGGAGRYSVLHVEENEADRYALARALRRAGFKVMEAATAAEALEAVKTHPDLVLLQVGLPDMDGYEVCRRIKADPDTARIPVLHLAATGDSGSAKGAESGDDGFLVQPLPADELVATVSALINRAASKSTGE